MQSASTNRREFLKTSAAAAAVATAIPGGISDSRANEAAPKSKNDRPNIACIGVGSRGSSISRLAAEFGDIVAICDADLLQAEAAKKAFAGNATIYQDYREVLERSDVDVIINGTPDHWHTAVNVAACRAGKDVYTEKPLTLTIDEGKILCQVVEETKRVVQVGTQQRSGKDFQTAIELVRNGRIGNLKQVWVGLPYYSTWGGPFSEQPVPDSLNWDLYQGQTPVHPYCKTRTHSNFRWWYEYSGGVITDWGNHQIDIAHWGMDCETTGPISIDARGLFPNKGEPNCYNTPDRFFSKMAYANGVEMSYFVALGDQHKYGDVKGHAKTTEEEMAWLFEDDTPDEIKNSSRNGITFIGDKGRIFVNRGGVYGKAAEELAEDPLPEDAWRVRPSDNHMGNFFACVANREEPVSPVQVQHRTVSVCHLTNISIRLQRPLKWDPVAQQILGDDEANSYLQRQQRSPWGITA
ncbi:MAG: Gfo/Idh/MocA family oxidoreductase [Planctomycetes bacterium]|nr:Gfo/Idh/MocA family oxidoreductase [Planctomycetota bacterium]